MSFLSEIAAFGNSSATTSPVSIYDIRRPDGFLPPHLKKICASQIAHHVPTLLGIKIQTK